VDAHVSTAQVTWPLFNSLQCFWPGMQMLIGELDHGIETLRAFHTLWKHLGFHPEVRLALAHGQMGWARAGQVYGAGQHDG
jgi:hypothetical protein